MTKNFAPCRLTVRIPEAMRMIGIGRSKFYELIKAHEVETIKLGNATLVLVESLEEFVEARRQHAGLRV